MEREYLFKVYYGDEFVKIVTAHTRWEAVEIVYSRLIPQYPYIIRTLFRANKI